MDGWTDPQAHSPFIQNVSHPHMARDQMSGVTRSLFVSCPEIAFHSSVLFARLSVHFPCAGWVGVVLCVPLDQVVEHVVLVIGHGRASIVG